MKKTFIYSIIVLALFCLASKSMRHQLTDNSLSKVHIKDHLPDEPITSNYDELLKSIQSKKKKFSKQFQDHDYTKIDSLQKVLSEYVCTIMTEEILPHWYGTEWDYNGHTNIPNDGEIACGYLVSTSLKHFGFNLNRYKFAQQASYYEAMSLNLGKAPTTIRNKDVKSFEESFKNAETDGLYIVGLDNHVGFLYLQNETLYFIHSDYISDKVKYELVSDSQAFKSSIYVYSPISNNTELLHKWLYDEELKVYVP